MVLYFNRVLTILVTPLDVIKTRMQAKTLADQGVISALKVITKTEGARGLWKGLVPTLVMQVPATGLYVI